MRMTVRHRVAMLVIPVLVLLCYPGAPVAGAPSPSEEKLIFSAPKPDAHVRGSVTFSGRAVGMRNVELFVGGQRLAQIVPGRDGTWQATLDFDRQPHGPLVVNAHAWDSPPGTKFTREDAADLAIVNDGGLAPPPEAVLVEPVGKPAPKWDMSGGGGWTLTFNEEFSSGLSLWEGPGSRGKWKTWFYHGDRVLNANGERQYYMDPHYTGSCGKPLGVDPFRIKGGVLAIEAEPTDTAVKPCIWNYDFTSGLITTEPSFQQRYGRFVARMKLPRGKGLWPAFWLLPADKSWPPEIDVLEFFGGPNSRGEGGTAKYHYGAMNSGGDWLDTGVDLTADFHEYGVEWTAKELTYTFDGREVAKIGTPPDAHKPMYMLINLAVGGTWPEMPDASAHWPARLDVDWVRAYRTAGGRAGN